MLYSGLFTMLVPSASSIQLHAIASVSPAATDSCPGGYPTEIDRSGSLGDKSDRKYLIRHYLLAILIGVVIGLVGACENASKN
jgi:hypothetical protein